MIFTLDPGKNGCGIAWGHAGKLVGARYVENLAKSQDPIASAVYFSERVFGFVMRDLAYSSFEKLVVEHPRIYFGSKKRNDKNDLFPLVALAAALAVRFYDDNPAAVIQTVYPADWKGQVKKEVMTARIKKRLGPDEEDKVVKHSKALDHNTYDAVGILLWEMGRL